MSLYRSALFAFARLCWPLLTLLSRALLVLLAQAAAKRQLKDARKKDRYGKDRAANGNAAEAANGAARFWTRLSAPSSRIEPSNSAVDPPALHAGESWIACVSALSAKQEEKLLTEPTIMERKAMYDCHEVDYCFVHKTQAFRECVVHASASAMSLAQTRSSPCIQPTCASFLPALSPDRTCALATTVVQPPS